MRRFGPTTIALALAVMLASCGKSEPTATAPAAPELTPEQKQAALASLPAPYNAGDLKNGKSKYALCQSCHTLAEGGPNLTGPNLYGVFGRKAGTSEYPYSDALKSAGFVWDAGRLDEWLANPRTYLPGTKMSFAGLRDPKDRTDLIAFLKVETGYKAP